MANHVEKSTGEFRHGAHRHGSMDTPPLSQAQTLHRPGPSPRELEKFLMPLRLHLFLFLAVAHPLLTQQLSVPVACVLCCRSCTLLPPPTKPPTATQAFSCHASITTITVSTHPKVPTFPRGSAKVSSSFNPLFVSLLLHLTPHVLSRRCVLWPTFSLPARCMVPGLRRRRSQTAGAVRHR